MVVLKTILPDTRGHEDIVRMFLNEARVTAEFSHPNIVQVYDLGIENDMLFLAMEYVQGCNVVEMVRACHAAQQTIPMGFTLSIVRDTALALSYAHTFMDMRHRKKPVVHRDVAGKNIMVTYEGTTKLLDFGIAKTQGGSSHTFAGTVKGTSGYMSPEQILGKPLDGRSDIFSLGIVTHECLTGYRLFHESAPEKKKTAVLDNKILAPSSINPDIPKALDAVIMKALERNPENRFQTSLEFARALEEAAGEWMWRAEQVGELVSLHFSQRRQQTRKLIEDVQARLNDFTGQIRIEDFLSPNTFEKMLLSQNDSQEDEEALSEEAFTSSSEKTVLAEILDTSPTEESVPPSLSMETASLPPPSGVHTPSALKNSSSALIPIRTPSPQEKQETTSETASASQSENHKAPENSLLQRLLSSRYFMLVSVSLLLGVVLAVVLFWIFTGFGSPH